VPHVSTVWLCAARLHWATVSEIWQRATRQHGPVKPADVETMLVSAATRACSHVGLRHVQPDHAQTS